MTTQADKRFDWLYCQITRREISKNETVTLWFLKPGDTKEQSHIVSKDKFRHKNCYHKVCQPGFYVIKPVAIPHKSGCNHHIWTDGAKFPDSKMWKKSFDTYRKTRDIMTALNDLAEWQEAKRREREMWENLFATDNEDETV